ncbi:ATP-binding protein [Streptomyces acidiscabies]|uniref:Histidine kinase n=1 Tax=Streptomyces acidiscabies TaxID=42234 RepID=A0A0L0K3G9_9ACTN|nr:ATP-binding protein [Streptomyces acidiscabies]KND32135.1 histidine kinase [Streptomyces acidiscabies]
MEHPDRFVVACSREPQRVGQMRRIGAAHLKLWGLNSCVDTATLLISELVTNAIRYGTEDITFSLSHKAGEITIEVIDGSSEFPQVRQPAADKESGRGMFLVEAMADRWGTSEDGTRTWCTIAVPQPLRPIAGFWSEWRQGDRVVASGAYVTPEDTLRYARAQLRLFAAAFKAEMFGDMWEYLAEWGSCLEALKNGEETTATFGYDRFALAWDVRPVLFLPLVGGNPPPHLPGGV